MKTLVIANLQKDYYDPSGAVYVKGGEKVVEKIKQLILNDLSINQIIFAIEWHTLEDYSFKKNGGDLNMHCLQYSEGASLSREVMEAVMYRGFTSVDGSYYRKGEEAEVDKFFLSGTYDVFHGGDIPGEKESGAFGGDFEQLEGDDDVWCMTGASGDSCAYLNVQNDVVICGLGEIIETAKNLISVLEEGNGKFMMYLPGIASINNRMLEEWIKQENIEAYEYKK